MRTNVRREFTRKTKRLAWERCGGRCEAYRPVPYQTAGGLPYQRLERCGSMLRPGHFVYDHIDPDWFSKDNELDNCQVICDLCDRDKTAKDQGDIAKSKRIIDKGIKALTSRRPLPGGKHDRRKKRIDGTVVERRTGKPL